MKELNENKLAFLFPGQGSQYVGMGQALCNRFIVARNTFEEASDVLHLDIAKLCFETSPSILNRVDNALVAILVYSVAAYRVFVGEGGPCPGFCAGHSLGEYTALTCSNALKFEDALKIVQFRAKLAQKSVESNVGMMTVVEGIDYTMVEEECYKASAPNSFVAVACYNASKQVVISGAQKPMLEVEDVFLGLDAHVTPLFASPPFHCALMLEESLELKSELNKYLFSSPKCSIISNVNALPYKECENIREMLSRQLVEPVQWYKTMKYLTDKSVVLTVEIGPKNVLTNLIKSIEPNINAFFFEQRGGIQNLVNSILMIVGV